MAGESILEEEKSVEERASAGGSGGERERERACALASSFYMFSSPAHALCKLGATTSAILPEVLTPVLGPSLTFLCSVFVGFSLPRLLPPPFWTPFPYSNYLTKALQQK